MDVSTSQLVSVRNLLGRPSIGARATVASTPVLDQRGRPLADLRLSVTEHCNFHCSYCRPRGAHGPSAFDAAHGGALSVDELHAIASAFVALGVRKIRVTGGEPLLRKDLAQLIERLACLELDDLCLTTNGSLLGPQAQSLARAGLQRVTVSLDALDEITFRRMTDGAIPLSQVLRGIDEARRTGLEPVKINMVVRRGVNEHAVLPMAAWARREGIELRYIEYMDVGGTHGWRMEDVVTADEILQAVGRVWPLEPTSSTRGSHPAERYRYDDGAGYVGIVAAISRPFCGTCTRARISSRGLFYPCLFASSGTDLVRPLRAGTELRSIIAELWSSRADRYSETRSPELERKPRPEMVMIGG